MPETPEELWARARGALRAPPVQEWETFPFVGAAHPRELEPPVAAEPSRQGAGGAGCRRCLDGEEGALWSNENWIVRAPPPNGLPMVVLLETRAHHDFPDLPPDLAAELGPMLLRVQRAVFAVGQIGNVHVCRWGDGGEHCHV